MGRNNGSPTHEHSSSKYKTYVGAVDKALKAFEYSTEWADLIKALGSLTKVFHQYAKLGELARAPTVCKRLSQCLHPALPSGVHLKALETFREIFHLLGRDGLPRHIHLFAVGLFPVMGFAGIRVKTELIKILNEFFLPLGAALKPSTVGLVAGVLHGLEEGSDFYDSINSLLIKLQKAVGADYLFTCLWECIRSIPSIRLPALLFIGQNFDRKASMDDQLYVMGTSVETMVCSLCEACCTVNDQALLVQRNLLDFIIAAFPVNSEQLVRGDLVRLMRAVLFIVFRREMSLNRRLYSWLLNCSGQQVTAVDVSGSSGPPLDLTFFRTVSLPILCDAFQLHLKAARQAMQPLTGVNSLLRLLAYLLDKGDIGAIVLDNTLLPLLTSVLVDKFLPQREHSLSALAQVKPLLKQKTHQRNMSVVSTAAMQASATPGPAADASRADFVRVVNMLLALTPTGYVWSHLSASCLELQQQSKAEDDQQQQPSRSMLSLRQFVKVVDVLLVNVDLDQSADTRQDHLLQLVVAVVAQMRRCQSLLTVEERIQLYECLIHLLPECAQSERLTEPKTNPELTRLQQGVDDFLYVFGEQLQQRSPVRQVKVACQLLVGFGQFHVDLRPPGQRKEHSSAAFTDCVWLKGLCNLALRGTYDGCLDCISTLLRITESSPGLFTRDSLLWEHLERVGFWQQCASHLWRLLGAADGQHHTAVAALINALHGRLGDDSHCEHTVMAYFASQHKGERIEGISLFVHYWNLCRTYVHQTPKAVKPMNRASLTLLTMVYADQIDSTALQLCEQWLVSCVQSAYFPSMLKALCTQLLHEGSARVSVQYIEFDSVTRVGDLRLPGAASPSLPSDLAKQLLITLTMKDDLRLHHCTAAGNGYEKYLTLMKELLLDEKRGCDETTRRLSQAAAQADDDALSPLANSASGGALSAARDPSAPSSGAAKFRRVHNHNRYKQSFDQDALRDIIYTANLEDVDIAVRQVVDRLVSRVVELVDDVLLVDEPRSPVVLKHDDTTFSLDYSNYKASDREVLSDCIDALQETESGFQSNESETESPTDSSTLQLFHPLHVHVLLYCEKAKDCELPRARCLFTVLARLLQSEPNAAVVAGSLISSSPSGKSDGSADLRISHLMHSHMCAILGQTYWMHNQNVTSPARNKQYTFVEVLLTVSLYYLRSYFACDPTADITEEDRIDNCTLKVSVLKFLSALLHQVHLLLAKHQSPGLCTHVFDMLTVCKLQKTMIHTLMVCVNPLSEPESKHLSSQVITYNQTVDTTNQRRLAAIQTEYEQWLLNVCASIVELEHLIGHGKDNWAENSLRKTSFNDAGLKADDGTAYGANTPLAKLKIFLYTILKALKSRFATHHIWFAFVRRITPYLDSSVGLFIVQISEQLCRNVSLCSRSASLGCDESVPTAYLAQTLECVTALQHYLLVDNNNTTQPYLSPGASGGTPDDVRDSRTTEFFSNIFKVFTGFGDSSTGYSSHLDMRNDSTASAQQHVLSKLPDVLGTLCALWQRLNDPAGVEDNYLLADKPRLEHLMLDLLKPLALDYSTHFLCALADVWALNRQDVPKPVFDFSLNTSYSASQLAQTDLLLSMKVLPLESMIRPLSQAVKQTTKLADNKDVCLLEMLHACLQRSAGSIQHNCWPALQSLLNELLVACDNASVTCLLFIIFVDHVRACRSDLAVSDDRALQKSYQEVFQKLVDALNTIVGWQLEQSTWLKRTIVKDQTAESDHIMAMHQAHSVTDVSSMGTSSTSGVGSGLLLQPPNPPGSARSLIAEESGTVVATASSLATSASTSSFDTKAMAISASDVRRSGNGDKSKHLYQCTQALCILAEHITDVLDCICKSDDKDKMLPTLYAVWANTLPYLKARKNKMNFLMACKLLSTLSAHSYTRTVWRKSAVELFFESNFFQMNELCTSQWKAIIDNLIIHDKTASKELFTRLSPSQGVVPFMANKESEYEHRASSVRRLAFIICSAGFDQFQPHLADIQERLTDHLRNYQVPQVYAHILLCFRVLIVRLSPQYLLALWPVIVTELMQTFVLMDQHIQLPRGQTPDEMKCNREDYWLRFYLSACKLLHTLMLIPSSYLPHFQLYQWSFVSPVRCASQQTQDADTSSTGSHGEQQFVPLVVGIERKLRARFASTPGGQPAPANWKAKTVADFSQMLSFVHELSSGLANSGDRRPGAVGLLVNSQLESDRQTQQALAEIDEMLIGEFSDGF